MLEAFVRQLSEELGMEEAMQPEPGVYRFSFEEDLDIDISTLPQQNGYVFKSTIGAVPQQNADAFFVQLMNANVFGQGTFGAVLGLNSEGNLLTLSLELDYNSSYKEFRDKVEDFINVIDFWKNQSLKHQ
jgi:hypothetical protein